jgi:hypothetical protein
MFKGAVEAADPLLTYALQSMPNPIQAGGGATLKLLVSNGGDDLVTCVSIQLTLPVGDDASDLIDGSATIATRPATGWTATVSGGVVTFTAPDGGAVIEGDGMTFALTTQANAQPGTATLALTENASDDGGAVEPRNASFLLNKFPVDFSLSELTTVPPDTGLDVAYGNPAVLNWTAAGAGVTCTLQYQPVDGGAVVDAAVPNAAPAGAFQTQPLTSAHGVIFTLIAKVNVIGRDAPLVVQRQLAVTVESPSLSVVVGPPRVAPGGLVALQWTAANVDHCVLQDGTILPLSGTRYYVVTQDQSFTVSAVGAAGQTLKQQQGTVTVDPAIHPTLPAYVDTAPDGGPGAGPWVHYVRSSEGLMPVWEGAGSGGNGADAAPTVALAPLDMTGGSGRVMAIQVTGGNGGPGGDGNGNAPWPGNGGNGGNAILTATFDPAQGSPTQYIIALAVGGGGAAGQVGDPAFSPGSPGGPGTVKAATINGQPVSFGG